MRWVGYILLRIATDLVSLLSRAIIEAIIATKYPTPGAEFAALQNGPESVAEHQAMRVLAKELVAGWLAATPSE